MKLQVKIFMKSRWSSLRAINKTSVKFCEIKVNIITPVTQAYKHSSVNSDLNIVNPFKN